MKNFFFILLALFLLISCGGDDPEHEYAAVQGTLNGTCYPNKTCNEGLICSENDICVKQGENGDTDNPANHDLDADSGNSSENDTSESEDENNDASDSVSDNDPDENGSECGNGTKEEGELCEKGDYVNCSEVDDQYSSSNFAICNDSCSGWNTDNCESSQPSAQPLASFSARTHELTYLYNGLTAFEKMENQEDELWKTALFNASISMNGETYSIPHPQANVHWITAY